MNQKIVNLMLVLSFHADVFGQSSIGWISLRTPP